MAAHVHHPLARSRASLMIQEYGGAALPVAEDMVDTRIKAGDMDGALELDQIRREIAFQLGGHAANAH